ncbi:MAG: Cytochrome b-c1 complex subunit 7 [Watsoniomyces obsoletus]|nr:MAG: Cytochrome b-c1 complex subunit 7 [Watsoniomyces obsoletus]
MNIVGGAAARLQTTAWTCRLCLARQSRLPTLRSQIHTRKPKPPRNANGRKQRMLLAATTAGVIGGTALAFVDDIRHGYAATTRAGRVASTLAICINDYRVTLNHQSDDDEAERIKLLKECHKRCAKRTLKVMEANGSIFIKLGQHLSSLNYLLPMEWTSTFIPLQDHCPISSYVSIEDMFRKDTGGKSISDFFSEFDQLPIGAASLAQVHRAILKDTGQKVAVKVQHPTLQEWVPLDLMLMRFTFSTLKRFFPEYDLEWLSKEMEMSLPQELDFNQEGKNALRAREYFSHVDEPALVIPDVVWSQKRILVMEYMTGHRPDDLEYLDTNNIDRDEVSAALARIFNEMIFGQNAPLHCDPHGGNLAIRKNTTRRHPNFDIILYDHGLYRDIPIDLRRSYAKLWLAVIDADEAKMRKYAYEVAGVNDEQFPLFASAITGRDYRVVTQSVVINPRTEHEKEEITKAMGDGVLTELVQLLGQIPRIILLILKTNDLTRSLDENLHTRLGPVRTFLILARYCTRTVFQEQMEIITQHGGGLLRDGNLIRFLKAWGSYIRIEVKLSLYETWLSLRRMLGGNVWVSSPGVVSVMKK